MSIIYDHNAQKIVIDEMRELAKRASAKMDGEYVSVSLEVTASGEFIRHEWTGYTSVGGHQKRDSFSEMAESILPDKCKMEKKVQELLQEAEAIKKLISKV